MKVRTRFAPSPTGTPESIHLGFIIRALWGYAFAKKNNGDFILRIEDTDRKRSRKDTEESIYKALKTYGLSWDEGPDIGGPFGPYRQSERLDKYQAAAQELVEKDSAYYDFETQKRELEEIKNSHNAEMKIVRPPARNADPIEAKKRVDAGEPFVVRAKIHEGKIYKFHDFILKKDVQWTGDMVPDAILLKSDGFPTYHLAVVVDDIDMQISHVFRGQEWISSTPIHLHLYEAFKKDLPEIGHFTVILDPRTGKKFSKRDLTAMFGAYKWLDDGYLPEAILNYLMLLGWAPKDNRELFTLDEFVQAIDPNGFQKANPTFNQAKLDWFNQQYIKKLSDEDLAQKLVKFTAHTGIEKIAPLVRERLVSFKDFDSLTDYFFAKPTIDKQAWAKLPHDPAPILEVATVALSENFDGKYLEEKARAFCAQKDIKVGDFFMTLRLAVTGRTATPPLWDVMQVLGKEETLARINTAHATEK